VRKPTTKIAVRIPDELYRVLERARRARGLTLSAAIEEALWYWLNHDTQRKTVREYEVGYRRKPESLREINAAEAAASTFLAVEDW
jgi:hypothetical protein